MACDYFSIIYTLDVGMDLNQTNNITRQNQAAGQHAQMLSCSSVPTNGKAIKLVLNSRAIWALFQYKDSFIIQTPPGIGISIWWDDHYTGKIKILFRAGTLIPIFGLNKITAILRQARFWAHFGKKDFLFSFMEVCFYMSSWHFGSIISEKGLTPSIIWPNYDPVH